MSKVTRKTFLTRVDGTPKKRSFLAIISDYDLKTGLCELIDNAIDHWSDNGRSTKLSVEITLDHERQLVRVWDNAGGLAEEDAELLVAPGASGNALDKTSIGIFGVGGKRAAVALGELVEIRTRRNNKRSFQVDLTKEWVEDPDWYLDIYEIPDITPGTTSVEITKVRQGFDGEDINIIRRHIGETYSWFIGQGCKISVNSEIVQPAVFDAWAYPPEFVPKHVTFQVEPSPGKFLQVEMTGGLILDRVKDAENYGVYFTCNERLIVKELKVREVGYYVPSEAGTPHPDASLARVIVKFFGPAELMPWNSSKSGINYSHPAFMSVRGRIIDFASYFSTVSRRLKHDWENTVFTHKSGVFEELDPAEARSAKKKILPKPPSSKRLSRFEQAITVNQKKLQNDRWMRGLVEALGLVDVIAGQKKFEYRNRAALILLDSNFEIALKEFIVHRKDLFPAHIWTNVKLSQLFVSRTNVIREVTAKVSFPQTWLNKINHYYDLRNNLVHQRASVPVSDGDIDDYRDIIERVLKKLFELKFPNEISHL